VTTWLAAQQPIYRVWWNLQIIRFEPIGTKYKCLNRSFWAFVWLYSASLHQEYLKPM
jgi:hypothetical protein